MTPQRFLTLLSAALLAGLGAAACSTDGADQRAEAQMAEADAVLANYTETGETRSCLSLRAIDEIEPLDETRWLITTRGGEAYLNVVSRGCGRAASDFTYLQYSTPTGQLCDNESVRVLDRGADTFAGSCGLGVHQRLEPVGGAG